MCVLNDVYISGRPRPTAINIHYFLKVYFFIRYTFIKILVTGGGHLARKPDLVAYQQQRHRPGCAFMQSDPHRCYLLNTNVYNIQIGFIKKMQEGPAQTAHPCNLIDATNNHLTTRVTNKIVPHRKRSFAFRVLVSLKHVM